MRANRLCTVYAAPVLALLIVGAFIIPAFSFAAGESQVPICTGVSSWWSGFCWIQWIVSVVGEIGILLSATIAGLSAGLFNTLLDYTVLQFGSYYGIIKIGVETAWAVFRDVANIVIIASFVFVAISTILGSQSYGYKQFVVRLIIAATLINFSLFFTKAAIDVSHLFAAAFNQGIPVSTASATQNALPTGVAGEIMRVSGITTVWDGGELVKKISNSSQSNGNALLYIILTMMFFGGITLVFLYGAALLLVRMIILVFLMMTSSLAFGARAIPGLSKWWDLWLKEFLKNLFFAPLFFMFLWAVLTITRNLAPQGGATLADVAANPADGSGITTVINYIIVLGLLYAGIHTAKSLSVRGSSKLPDWKAILKGASMGVKGVRNAGRFYQSKRADAKLKSEKGQRKIIELGNLKALIKQDRATPKQRRDAINLEKEVGSLQAKAKGDFGILDPRFTKGLDQMKKVLTEGAGKGGYEAFSKQQTKDKEAQEKWLNDKISEAYKSNVPTDQDKRKAYEAEVGRRMETDKTRVANLERDHKEKETRLNEIERLVAAGTASPEQTQEKERMSIELGEVKNRIAEAKMKAINPEERRKEIERDVLDDLSSIEKQFKKNSENITGAFKDREGKALDTTSHLTSLYKKAAEKNADISKRLYGGDTYMEKKVVTEKKEAGEKEKKKQELMGFLRELMDEKGDSSPKDTGGKDAKEKK